MSAVPARIGASSFVSSRGIVLTVAVEPHRQLVAVREGVLETRLHGAADPEVEREDDHRRPVGRGDGRRGVRRPVVDHDDVERRVEGPDLVDDVADRPLLVVGGHDRDHTALAHGTAAPSCRRSTTRRARWA